MTAGEGPESAAEPSSAEAGSEGFVLHLQVFDGPLDLLLHLIEREELDITEVSLLAVTEQYLRQLRATEHMDLAALAEFVAMGARLLLLKSRALLPRDEREEEQDTADGPDPAGLIAALQEFQRYKRAAEHLRELEDAHRTGYRREASPPAVQLPSGLDEVTLDALAGFFREVLERLPEDEEIPEVEREPVRLADSVASLSAVLKSDGRASFRQWVGSARSRVEVVVGFLAVLELIKEGFLLARQSDAFGDIELVRIEGGAAPTETELAEGVADV